jgi:hypothetical protein
MRSARVLLIGLSLLAALPAHAKDTPAALVPYDDLLEVLAVLVWHLDDDGYRFPPPKDPTGHDVFTLTLDRLAGWEQRFPGRMRDVIGFATAQALERSRAYAGARDAYGAVAAMTRGRKGKTERKRSGDEKRQDLEEERSTRVCIRVVREEENRLRRMDKNGLQWV